MGKDIITFVIKGIKSDYNISKPTIVYVLGLYFLPFIEMNAYLDTRVFVPPSRSSKTVVNKLGFRNPFSLMSSAVNVPLSTLASGARLSTIFPGLSRIRSK